jgi:hypothetical protein
MSKQRIPAVLLLAFLAGCGGSDSPSATPSQEPTTSTPSPTPSPTKSVGEFEQTWGKPYNKTTCTEWASRMNAHERRVAAADMLINAQGVDGEGGNEMPSRELRLRFEGDISEACTASGTSNIAEIAAGVFIIGKDQYED